MSRANFYTANGISIEDLLLDTHNPRIRHGQDQNDCIFRILRDKKNFLNLLRDIASNGLSPEHILVSPNSEGKFVVRDGNRRVTALKLLNRPDLCRADNALTLLVTKIAETHRDSIPKAIDCLACNDEKIILMYLERKHTGENTGIGQRNWSSLLKALFNLQLGVNDQMKRAAQLIMWAEEHGLQVDDEFPITTLQRGLNNETLHLIGFEIVNDKVTPIISDNQAYALVARVITAVALREVNVKRDGETGSIFSPEDQLAFYESVRKELGPPLREHSQENNAPDPSGSHANHEETSKPGDTSSPKAPDSSEEENKGTTSNRTPSTPTRPPWDRPCIFGRRKNSSPGFNVPSSSTKVQTIVNELRKLNPEQTPLAVSMLLRALIELSNEHYRTACEITKSCGTLHQSIAASADHMKDSNLISNNEYDIILRYTRTQESMLHIKTLQAYLHNAVFHPNAQALNTFWDEIGCFIRACWRK